MPASGTPITIHPSDFRQSISITIDPAPSGEFAGSGAEYEDASADVQAALPALIDALVYAATDGVTACGVTVVQHDGTTTVSQWTAPEEDAPAP